MTSPAHPSPALQQGACIALIGAADGPAAEAGFYQVIGIDDRADRCWLRRWPLARHGSPVVELSLRQVQARGLHRSHLAGRPA
ncbi:MAG: hypothetical protein ACKOPN_06525 [Prochlorococcaceae cyanobacterium]